jgi:two-component system NtrC family sensor kinase
VKVSIRKRLMVILASTLGMLAVFCVTGILSVRCMRRLVDDLDNSIRSAPHSSEMLASIAKFGSLLMTFPDSSAADKRAEWLRLQMSDINDRVTDLRTSANDFRRKVQESMIHQQGLSSEDAAMTRLLQEIDQQVRYIEEAVPPLQEAGSEVEEIRWLYQLTSKLTESLVSLPDPADRLQSKLQKAQSDYRSQTWVIVITTIVGAGATTWAALAMRYWILHPIRELMHGARMVANGNYHYRQTIRTGDELAALGQMFNNVTERFEQEVTNRDNLVREQTQQLLQSERLAGVGFLASGVAHEINNPLSAITACAGVIHERFHTDPKTWSETDIAECKEYLELIHQESHRCQSITRKMLDFAHGSDDDRHLYDVTAIVEDVVSIVKHLGEYSDRKIAVHRTEPCEAWINGQEIKQVILNLVANALQATGEGGHLDIRIRERPDQVEVEFTDDGTGMTPEIIQHIFDPFFTTKDVGKGTGMGLSISRSLVQGHGGALEASSEGLGRGSTFRIHLPSRPPTEIARAA